MSNRSSLIAKIGGLETEENVDVVSDIVSDVDALFDDLEAREDGIDDLKTEVNDLEKKLDNKKEEIEVLEETVEELENKSPVEFDKKMHNNIRTQSVLEDLLINIDYIPINELEDFVAKHRKL